MFDKTVTIFNQSNGVWYPKTYRNAQVITDRGYVRRVYGDTANDSVIVHIPCKYGVGTCLLTDEIEFVLPKEFDASADKSTIATFRSGVNFDIILIGEYENTPIADDEYSGGFYKHLKSEKDGVYALTNVAQYYVVPHFELTGK